MIIRKPNCTSPWKDNLPILNCSREKAKTRKLSKSENFDIAGSADIDKMKSDEIHKATGCSRDTCATSIGEQLGVDRVVSSSFMKNDENYYVVSGKMMDIQDGSILVSEQWNIQENSELSGAL